jgi:uncharacterized protein
MWTCTNCSEEHQAEMQVCWNCGTNIDGTPDPTFSQVDQRSPPSPPPHPEEMTLDEQIEQAFVCSKCSSKSGQVKRLAMTGTGLSRIVDLQHNTYLAVSCRDCGFTQLFDLEVFEGKDVWRSLIDLWFSALSIVAQLRFQLSPQWTALRISMRRFQFGLLLLGLWSIRMQAADPPTLGGRV